MKKMKYLLIGAVVITLLFSTSSSIGFVSKFKKDDLSSLDIFLPRGAVLEVTTDKNLYNTGETVTIFFTNIGDETLSGGGPIVSYYNHEEELIYQEAVYCWWELEPNDYFTWKWDQKDFNKEQVPEGEYTVEGFLSGGENGFLDSATFCILNYDPPGPPSGPSEGVVNVSYTYCIDLPDEPACEPYFVIWFWGDGDMSEWLGPFVAEETVCANHSWSEPGSYAIKAGIRDGCGREYYTDPLIVNISTNSPPSKPTIKGPPKARPIYGVVGEDYNFTFRSVDPDGDDIFYLVDWGDGSWKDWFGPYKSGENATANHTWYNQGTYTVTAKAKDIHGLESDWSTMSIPIRGSKSKYQTYAVKLINIYCQNIIIILRQLLLL